MKILKIFANVCSTYRQKSCDSVESLESTDSSGNGTECQTRPVMSYTTGMYLPYLLHIFTKKLVLTFTNEILKVVETARAREVFLLDFLISFMSDLG